MMELIRSWLLGITAAAMIAAAADALAPDGAAKKACRLASGLLILLAVVKPVLTLDPADLSKELARYRAASQGYSAALETENLRLMKSIIEERTGAYIQDKAAELGIDCKAEVICSVGEDETPYPAQVTICGELTQSQIKALSRVIAEELSIPEQEQSYERTSEG